MPAQAAQILTGNLLVDGVTYHAADINQAVNGATLLPGAISAQAMSTASQDMSFLIMTGDGIGLGRTTLSSAMTLFSTNLSTVGYLNVGNGLAINGFISATINGTQNNYNPTNLDKAVTVQLAGTATLTGLMAGAIGKVVIIKSAGNITINLNDAGSDPANRFGGFTSNFTLISTQIAAFYYIGGFWNLLFTNRTF